MGLKIVIADPKAGKSLQKEVEDAKFLMGLKIGNTFKGENLDLTGYEFKITGGSDASGFPMRKDIEGSKRVKILAVKGVGLKEKRKGQRQRKTVAGGTISQNTAQLNVIVTKAGSQSLFEEPASETPAENAEA
ncbi:MAG: 30S ribosomal protein S6e [Candidatus Woesearchaeota archaeon]